MRDVLTVPLNFQVDPASGYGVAYASPSIAAKGFSLRLLDLACGRGREAQGLYQMKGSR